MGIGQKASDQEIGECTEHRGELLGEIGAGLKAEKVTEKRAKV